METQTGLGAISVLRIMEAKGRMNMTFADFEELGKILQRARGGSRSDYDLKIEEIARNILM
jgi:predicted DNA-binding helix-hairpin-helix protein